MTLPAGVRRATVQRWRGGGPPGNGPGDDDLVADETPVAMLYNDLPFAVMLASPTDLDDFALGFALGEGVVEHADEFRLVDRQVNDDGIALHAHIPQARFDAIESRRRRTSGRSGCGWCGAELLQQVDRPSPVVTADHRIDAGDIHAGLDSLAAAQALNALTGGMHAAAHVGADGLLLREDIGRHNAVDKLVGALARASRRPGFLLVTSRASYEIVHKAAHAGLGIVVAISAPTSLAIRLAERCGITLAGFARDDALNVYSHGWRLSQAGPGARS